jgi:hypothetical protein
MESAMDITFIVNTSANTILGSIIMDITILHIMELHLEFREQEAVYVHLVDSAEVAAAEEDRKKDF